MKKFLMTLLLAVFTVAGIANAAAPKGWETDFDKALAKAKAERKYVYVTDRDYG